MNNHKKIWITLCFIVLIAGAFGYGYYSTLGKITNEKPNQKPGTFIDNKKYIPYIDDMDQGVNKVPDEDRVTPSMTLIKKITSINTGKEIIEYDGVVPDNLINLTKQQVVDYFKDYGVAELTDGKINVIKKLPNLPDHYIVKLENKYIVVYKTNSKGIATKYEGFEPILHKNRDSGLEKGIEVETEEEIWKKVQDYE